MNKYDNKVCSHHGRHSTAGVVDGIRVGQKEPMDVARTKCKDIKIEEKDKNQKNVEEEIKTFLTHLASIMSLSAATTYAGLCKPLR